MVYLIPPWRRGAGGIEEAMNEKSGYNKDHKPFARELRKKQTLGETLLWSKVLSVRKMKGYLFNRQYCIENYIVDFMCRELKLVIEIDGYSHDFKIDKDELRDKDLESKGYKVLRILERDILKNLEGVCLEISKTVEELIVSDQSP
jgi:very-short-patch-repair endonuclease